MASRCSFALLSFAFATPALPIPNLPFTPPNPKLPTVRVLLGLPNLAFALASIGLPIPGFPFTPPKPKMPPYPGLPDLSFAIAEPSLPIPGMPELVVTLQPFCPLDP